MRRSEASGYATRWLRTVKRAKLQLSALRTRSAIHRRDRIGVGDLGCASLRVFCTPAESGRRCVRSGHPHEGCRGQSAVSAREIEAAFHRPLDAVKLRQKKNIGISCRNRSARIAPLEA